MRSIVMCNLQFIFIWTGHAICAPWTTEELEEFKQIYKKAKKIDKKKSAQLRFRTEEFRFFVGCLEENSSNSFMS